MSEDDRAAKAARARALLKKRQQQKVAGSPAAVSTDSRVASPSPPPSRSFTPAPIEVHSPVQVEKNGHNLGDLFSRDTNGSGTAETQWLSSLERVETPPAASAVSPPPAFATSPPPEPVPTTSSPPPRSSLDSGGRGDLRKLIQEQAHVIATLEADKASLALSLQEIKHAESRAQQANDLLQEERSKVAKFEEPLKRMEKEISQLTSENVERQKVIVSLESEKSTLAASVKSLGAIESELQRSRDALQEEHGRTATFQLQMQQMNDGLNTASTRMREQEKYISSLESDKLALAASVKQLSDAQSKADSLEDDLQNERSANQSYQIRVQSLGASLQELTSRSEQQQQTISLLVSEKTTLTASVERLEDAESQLQEATNYLQQERHKADQLQTTVHRIEAEGRESSERITQLTARERELTDKYRDQERETQLLTGTTNDLRAESEQYQRRIRELEEQIESDDRAERLEATLQNTQDRAAELEFQVSKLKQSQATLKSERDGLEAELHQQKGTEAQWQERNAEVEKQHFATKEQLSSVTHERDDLLQERSSLQTQVEDNQTTLAELRQKLAQTVAEITTAVRALQQSQAELKNANRRADEAEKTQKDLQAEGIGLMRSLDEMRPKIVELTDVKLELGEKVDFLEKSLKSRDNVIAQLEASLEELREQKSVADKEHKQTSAALEMERSSSVENATELQKAYAELLNELQATRANVSNIEGERTEYRQLASRHLEEVDRLSASLHSQSEQIASLRVELNERSHARDEAREFLEHARTEMEALHAELAAKDEEIQQLQEAVSAPTTPGPHSLDEEMVSALKQQHALELSAAQSQIRMLETSVFQAEAKAHSLQRHLAVMEEQIAHMRSSSRASQRAGLPPRPLSRSINHSDDLRRASFGSHRPSNLAPPASNFEGLSPETRHKRRVSLGMLKARIDGEAAASSKSQSASRVVTPAQPPVKLPTVVEPTSAPGSPTTTTHSHSDSPRRAQFLDDSHIFWCSSCRGDLVIL